MSTYDKLAQVLYDQNNMNTRKNSGTTYDNTNNLKELLQIVENCKNKRGGRRMKHVRTQRGGMNTIKDISSALEKIMGKGKEVFKLIREKLRTELDDTELDDLQCFRKNLLNLQTSAPNAWIIIMSQLQISDIHWVLTGNVLFNHDEMATLVSKLIDYAIKKHNKIIKSVFNNKKSVKTEVVLKSTESREVNLFKITVNEYEWYGAKNERPYIRVYISDGAETVQYTEGHILIYRCNRIKRQKDHFQQLNQLFDRLIERMNAQLKDSLSTKKWNGWLLADIKATNSFMGTLSTSLNNMPNSILKFVNKTQKELIKANTYEIAQEAYTFHFPSANDATAASVNPVIMPINTHTPVNTTFESNYINRDTTEQMKTRFGYYASVMINFLLSISNRRPLHSNALVVDPLQGKRIQDPNSACLQLLSKIDNSIVYKMNQKTRDYQFTYVPHKKMIIDDNDSSKGRFVDHADLYLILIQEYNEEVESPNDDDQLQCGPQTNSAAAMLQENVVPEVQANTGSEASTNTESAAEEVIEVDIKDFAQIVQLTYQDNQDNHDNQDNQLGGKKPRKNTFEAMTLKELKTRASKRKIKGFSKMNKTDLIKALRR